MKTKNKTIKKKEIADALRERSRVLINNKMENVDNFTNDVIGIDELVNNIIESNEVLFSIEGEVGKGTIIYKNKNICNQIINYCNAPSLLDEITGHFSSHVFNPYITVFINNLRNISFIDKRSVRKVDMFNQLIEDIRTEVESKSFKADINNYRRLQSKNYKSLIVYIDNLFKQHDRLLIIRLVLTYKREMYGPVYNEDQSNMMYYKIKSDRGLLVKELLINPLLEHMAGYVWKLEYTLKKGFHMHMLFLLDGSKVPQDGNIAKVIGEYWQTTIAKGDGRYFNYNADKGGHQNLGIGMIDNFDTKRREELEKVAGYFTKTDYYLRLTTPDKGGRTFGKGQIKSNNLGRPREHVCSNSSFQ
jgi:hypothetical protein